MSAFPISILLLDFGIHFLAHWPILMIGISFYLDHHFNQLLTWVTKLKGKGRIWLCTETTRNELQSIYIRNTNIKNKITIPLSDVLIRVYLNLDFRFLIESSLFGFSTGAMFFGTTIFGKDDFSLDTFKRSTSSNR